MFLLAAQKSLLVDCPTQMAFVKRICQLCSMTNTSEKYERTQQEKLLANNKTTTLPTFYGALG